MINTNCGTCDKEIIKTQREINGSKSGKTFCSRSCAAKNNNLGVQHNKPIERTCAHCNIKYRCSKNNRIVLLCEKCSNTFRDRTDFYKAITYEQYLEEASIKNKHPSWKSSHIRAFCKRWNKDLTILPCQVCNYDTHIELCHIKPISSFNDTATLGEINSPKNILVLCRNHHWEFDNKVIKLKDIPKRKS